MGLCGSAADTSVTEFVEKPAPDQIDTNNISAGVYVLERSVLGTLRKGERASIERDVFPQLVGNGLFGYVAHGYWKDIGTPERYLEATFDILEGSVATAVAEPDGCDLRLGRERRWRMRAGSCPRRSLSLDVRLRRGRESAGAQCSDTGSRSGATRRLSRR